MLAGAAFGLLPGIVFARGLLAVVLAAPGILATIVAAFGLLALLVVGARLVGLLFLMGAFAVLVVTGCRGRRYAHGQDCGERNRAEDLSGEGEFHVDHLSAHANVTVGPRSTLRMRDEWTLRVANRIQQAAWVIVYRSRISGELVAGSVPATAVLVE
ncbi:MAG: hypothetical protein L0H23_05430 [Luteimonas sp.]|nr:hypothetical protein [Luteimonas sp.]